MPEEDQTCAAPAPRPRRWHEHPLCIAAAAAIVTVAFGDFVSWTQGLIVWAWPHLTFVFPIGWKQ